ncbi:hypothetical protein C7271_07635 [filamentous cyanobacterium CCP5]|nr:hypothetical protein C7271_07635 [filamentous cyanobacterium CCP5]
MSSPDQPSFLRLSLDQIWERRLLTIAPDTSVAIALEQMRSPPSADLAPDPDEPGVKTGFFSCALIVADHRLLGIFTRGDGDRCRSAGLDLENLAIVEVMTQPVVTISYSQAQDVSAAIAILKQHPIHHLPVVNTVGVPLGIITRRSLQQSLDPVELLWEIEQLRQLSVAQTQQLDGANQRLLEMTESLQAQIGDRQQLALSRHEVNRLLEEKVGVQAAQLIRTNESLRQEVAEHQRAQGQLERQHQQGRLLNEITRKLRDSLEIDEILQTAVAEVRELLACAWVIIIQAQTDGTGTVVQESRRPDQPGSGLHQVSGIQLMAQPSANAHACACEDLTSAADCFYALKFLQRCQARACIEVAIYADSQFWGLIIASRSDRPGPWERFEVELMEQLANQIGVAISHGQLLDNLEAQVLQRTDQLTQANQRLQREIQERIQIEADRLETQQQLAGILDNADEAIISIDAQQRIVMYNRGAEKIFGYGFEEVLNQPLDRLLPESFWQIHRQHVRTFAATPEVSRQMTDRDRDVFGLRNTGEAFPAEASISKLDTKTGPLFTVMLKDITEQRRAEAALRRSEEQLRLITNALPALICYVDTEQRYQFNNQTYTAWFQIPVADLRDRPVSEILGAPNYALAKPHIEKALSGQEVSYEAEFIPADGQPRYCLVTYIPDKDEGGTVKGFFGLITDISDRKAAERIKDEFVSIVGHELRTPLTSIHGSLVLLASKQLGSLTPEGEEFLDICLKNTQRLTRLINDVLDLERIESGRTPLALTQCQLGDLMVQAVQGMQAIATDQQVELVVAPSAAMVWADPDQVMQILTNLISNAIKFSPPGGKVWLRATRHVREVRVELEDQGRGIPSEKLEVIFERFQQVDASDSRQLGGTGLGLAICKNIVERHGGKIWAESIPGQGSRFYFTLPDSQP